MAINVSNSNVGTDDLRTPGPRVVICCAPKSSWLCENGVTVILIRDTKMVI